MKRLLGILPVLGLAACGDAGPRVTDAGPCLVAIERTVCHPTGGAPLCVPEAFLAVRRTPACLAVGPERGA